MSNLLNHKRIILRAVEPSDADFMYEIENDIDAWTYSDTTAPFSRRILREYALSYDADPFSARQLRLIITDQAGRHIGIVDLYEISPQHRNAFIGIYILPNFRKEGFAAEALEKTMAYGSQYLGLKILGAKIPVSNLPSIRLFSKVGFTESAALPGWLSLRDNSREALLIYTFRCE